MSKAKKFLSIILTILTAISLMTVAVSAYDADYEIKYGETITVTVDSEGDIYVKFVPEKDGKFVLKAESDGLDTYCRLLDDSGEGELEWADDEVGTDFNLLYEFEAGKTYYFNLGVYTEGTHEYKISLECGHNYYEGVCSDCNEPCEHKTMDFLGFCICGYVYIGTDIKDGDTVTYDAEALKNESGWYRFVPTESGAYCLEAVSDGESDSVCIVYDEDGNRLNENDDADADAGICDFKLYYGFEAGKTYYIEVYDYYLDAGFEMTLSRATYTDDDGNVHGLEYVAGYESTCIKKGLTEGLYCPDCDEYVWGHEEIALREYHVDEDWDDICDDCGEEIVYDEESDSDLDDIFDGDIVSLIQKIFDFFKNFFLKLFTVIGLW